jgi:hypothetical protein
LKGLYGLKQAGRIWNEGLKADIEDFGYTHCPRDHAVFRIGTWRQENLGVCACWVDDKTGVDSRYRMGRVAKLFCQRYGISGEGKLRWTLGIGVVRDFDAHIISLSQESYINDLIVRFGLENTHTVTTSPTPGAILTKEQCPRMPEEIQDILGNNYREPIGSPQYLAIATRPDVTFAVSKLAQFFANPGGVHFEAAILA